MRFDELVKAVLDMPPGSIVFAKRTEIGTCDTAGHDGDNHPRQPDCVNFMPALEIENVNGQDVRKTN